MVLLSLDASSGGSGSREGTQWVVPGGLRLNWSVHRAGEMPLPTHMVLRGMQCFLGWGPTWLGHSGHLERHGSEHLKWIDRLLCQEALLQMAELPAFSPMKVLAGTK